MLFFHIYFPIHLKPNTKHVILQCYVTKHGNALIRPHFLFSPRFFSGLVIAFVVLGLGHLLGLDT